MEPLGRVLQVFGLVHSYKKVSWVRIASGLILFAFGRILLYFSVMTAAFRPLMGIVREVSPTVIRVEGSDGAMRSFPPEVFEIPAVVGMEVALVIVPVGGETAGRSTLAKHLLNSLLG